MTLTEDELARQGRDWIDDLPGITQVQGVRFGELMVPVSAIRSHLAALRDTPVADTAGIDAALVALLVEFDGSVCPACHHRAHDPGSCSECPRCELHTDEALAFVLRYEPTLLNRAHVAHQTEHADRFDCWCGPTKHYEDPATGNQVWVHRDVVS